MAARRDYVTQSLTIYLVDWVTHVKRKGKVYTLHQLNKLYAEFSKCRAWGA